MRPVPARCVYIISAFSNLYSVLQVFCLFGRTTTKSIRSCTACSIRRALKTGRRTVLAAAIAAARLALCKCSSDTREAQPAGQGAPSYSCCPTLAPPWAAPAMPPAGRQGAAGGPDSVARHALLQFRAFHSPSPGFQRPSQAPLRRTELPRRTGASVQVAEGPGDKHYSAAVGCEVDQPAAAAILERTPPPPPPSAAAQLCSG